MGDDFNKNIGITAAVGCATGFLWSALAGKADISTGKGFARALVGCAASAFNATSVYTVSNHFFDRKIAAKITAGWFGFQSASSFTQTLGNRYGWHDSTAYNLIAFSLNFGAAPILSTVGLVWGIIGEAGAGSRSGVSLFGGSLVFKHDLCIKNYSTQLGATMQSCRDESKSTSYHELGHGAHFSIMGDFGMIGLMLLNGTGQLIVKQGIDYGNFIYEKWADDYAEKSLKQRRIEIKTSEKKGSDGKWGKLVDSLRGDMSYAKYEGEFYSFNISENEIIDGIPCSKDKKISVFEKSFKLKTATLSRDHPIKTKSFPKGTLISKGSEVTFYEDGKIKEIHFSKKYTIPKIPGSHLKNIETNKVTFRKNGRLERVALANDGPLGHAGSLVGFDKDGKPEYVILNKDYPIQGVPCAASSSLSVTGFHKNGRLKRTKLSTDHTIGNNTFPAGTAVTFDENRKLKEADLYASVIHIIDGYPCEKYSKVTFHNNDRLKTFKLHNDLLVKIRVDNPNQKIPCKAGQKMELYDTGNLNHAVLAKHFTTKEGIPCAAKTKIAFHEGGALKKATLLKDHKIDGVLYRGGSKLTFNKNGKLVYFKEK